jgi:hypothetical protein
MRQREFQEPGRRPGAFAFGVVTGAAAVAAYTLSCGSMTTATSGVGAPVASEVPYTNAQSGLKSTTVQAALDEIGTTMLAATKGTTQTDAAGTVPVADAAGIPTVWSIQTNVLDPNSGTMTSMSMGTVTFTESAPGQGSYETSGANVFMLDGLFGPATGTQTGKYFLVGDWLLMTGQVSGNNSGYTWLARLSAAGQTMTLNNAGAVVLALSKQ